MNSESALLKQRQDPGFWHEVWQQVRLVYHLVRDPEVPLYLKFLPLLAFVYMLSPIDFIPDALLIAGQLDDLTVLLVGAKVFIDLSPQHVVARHLEAIRTRDGYAILEEEDEVGKAIIIDPGHEFVQEESREKAE